MADNQPADFSERFNAAALPPDTLPSTEMFGTPAAMQVAVPRAMHAIFGGLSGYNILEFFGALGKKTMEGQEITPGEAMSAAMATVGGGAKFRMPEGVLGVAKDFHEQVMAPTAERVASNPSAISPIMGSDVPASMSRSELAKTGQPHIDAVIDSESNVIDNAVIDRNNVIPNSWGGHKDLNNTTTFMDYRFPKALSVPSKSDPARMITFDSAEGAVIHENIEHKVKQILTDAGMESDPALRAAYWGWGNPAEHAWYSSHDIDPAQVEKAIRPYLDRIATEKGEGLEGEYISKDGKKWTVTKTPEGQYQAQGPITKTAPGNESFINRILESEGATKIRNKNIPDDLYRGTYPDGNPQKASAGPIPKPSTEEMARAKQIIEDWQAGQASTVELFQTISGATKATVDVPQAGKFHFDLAKTSGGYSIDLVVHDTGGRTGKGVNAYQVLADHLAQEGKRLYVGKTELSPAAQAIHKKLDLGTDETGTFVKPVSEPEAAKPFVNPLQEARDLGVIGPERLPHPEDNPAQEAQRAIPASMKQDPNDKITMTPGGEPIGEYQKYFAEWVSKIKHPGDIDNLIMRAAKEQNFFEDIRLGDNREVPAAHIEELAKVTGFDSTNFDAKALRTRFTTDAEFRTAAQIMFQARDDAITGFERARNAATPENWNAASETFERFKIALKYMRRFSNDWNKTGRAQQEILDIERKQTQYKDRAREGVPKGVNDLVAAVGEFEGAPSKSALDKLLGTIKDAEKEVAPPRPPKEGEERTPQPKPSPELAELVRTARAVADLMNVERPKPSGVDTVRPLRAIVTEREPMPKNALASFNRLLSQAERTAGPKQEAIQRAASKQFPPDLQALIDKADFVTKRFGGIARERAEAQVAAEATAGLDKEGFSYVLGKAFEMSKSIADHTDKLFWLRNNWLLSGPVTHVFYFGVNSGTAVAKHILTPLVAAAIDRVHGGRNVFFGEAGAGALGLVSGVPGAFRAGMTAARTGLRVPLESELRLAERGEESPQARGSNIPYLAHASPDWGALKTAADWLGVPMKARNAAELMAGGAFGRFANMQHTMFKVLGESAQAHRNAYVAAVKEGLSPLTDKNFADRYTYHLKNPTDDALRDNVNAGFEGTFMQKLGPKTQRFASALRDTPLRWEFPFMHVPINITRMGASFSPLAFFGPEMRAQLMGQRGARPQALALAQVGIGTALLSHIMNLVLQSKATGDYPPDPEKRKQWKAENIQPNSVLIDGEWVSYNRLGPARIPMTIGANLGAIIKDYDTTKATDEEMAKAVGTAIVSTVHATSDEVGMLAMHNTLEAMNGQRGMAQYGAGVAASFLPYNVGAGQIAAFNDPYARQAKSFMDNIKYRIPYLRETLPAKRDAVYGEPLPNPAYHSLMRSVPATPDPIKVELDRLGYYPNPPQSKISHVQLTQEQYEKYEATAGQAVKRGLNELMYDPSYARMNDEERGTQARAVVRYFRSEARKAMQIDDPSLPMEGRENRLQQITGKPTMAPIAPGATPPPMTGPPRHRPEIPYETPSGFQPSGQLGIRG